MMALLASLSIPIGGVISANGWLRSLCFQHEIDSLVSYFGGGALLAAIALVLVPDGTANASPMLAAGTFLIGGMVFWQASSWIKRSGSSASQLMGMLLDFLPEAVVLGAAVATGTGGGMLLAMLIALQNMPEGFAAYHEMRSAGTKPGRVWAIFLLAPLLGPVAAWVGYACINMGSAFMAGLMLFASGGILYLIFQDIAPGAHLRHRDFPALGAVSEFLLGMLGTMMIH